MQWLLAVADVVCGAAGNSNAGFSSTRTMHGLLEVRRRSYGEGRASRTAVSCAENAFTKEEKATTATQNLPCLFLSISSALLLMSELLRALNVDVDASQRRDMVYRVGQLMPFRNDVSHPRHLDTPVGPFGILSLFIRSATAVGMKKAAAMSLMEVYTALPVRPKL